MLAIKIRTQPDDVTCGPTSLHAVYDYFGDKISLEQVVAEVSYLETGGTLAVMLGIHALKRGYSAKIYTYNLLVFDPTWFNEGPAEIAKKLRRQLNRKHSKKLQHATKSYLEFLALGGELLLEDLTPALIKKYLKQELPILTGLSATYLYHCAREFVTRNTGLIVRDDVRGHPSGHFVILAGYDSENKKVLVADPYQQDLTVGSNYYLVDTGRLINAIMLGILTYDANLLIIDPQGRNKT